LSNVTGIENRENRVEIYKRRWAERKPKRSGWIHTRSKGFYNSIPHKKTIRGVGG